MLCLTIIFNLYENTCLACTEATITQVSAKVTNSSTYNYETIQDSGIMEISKGNVKKAKSNHCIKIYETLDALSSTIEFGINRIG